MREPRRERASGITALRLDRNEAALGERRETKKFRFVFVIVGVASRRLKFCLHTSHSEFCQSEWRDESLIHKVPAQMKATSLRFFEWVTRCFFFSHTPHHTHTHTHVHAHTEVERELIHTVNVLCAMSCAPHCVPHCVYRSSSSLTRYMTRRCVAVGGWREPFFQKKDLQKQHINSV